MQKHGSRLPDHRVSMHLAKDRDEQASSLNLTPPTGTIFDNQEYGTATRALKAEVAEHWPKVQSRKRHGFSEELIYEHEETRKIYALLCIIISAAWRKRGLSLS